MDLLAQSDSGAGTGVLIYAAVWLAVAVLWIAGLWKTFEKAGIEGWWAVIPFANVWHLVKISGREWWWFLLYLVPCVNIIAHIVISLAVAERFHKSAMYGVGLWLFPFVFYPMLGFGIDEYEAPPTT